jgi:4-diphosphocytidyl-2C-methyl-D-erythritol kinase
MAISSETAKVYRGGGRLWLTLDAACNAEARAKIMEKCECQAFDSVGWSAHHNSCELHAPERYPKILRRLSRLHRNAYIKIGFK